MGSLRSFHTDFAYDLVGRVTEVLYPAQHYTVFNGWVDSTVRYDYDRGFLQGICDLGPTTDCASAPTKYVENATFDQLGRPKTMEFPMGTRTFSYDDVTFPNVPRLFNDNFNSPTSGYTYTRNYGQPDEIGNVKSIEGTDSATPALEMDMTYVYDQRNRISQWAIAGGATQIYEYDPLGNLTNHAGREQVYDDASRPNAITKRNPIGVGVYEYNYAYDDDGNVESIAGPTGTQYIEYDSANQAVCLSKNNSSCDTRVAYDVSGKRIAEYPGSQEYKVYIGDSFLFERSGTGTMANIEVMLDGKRIALKRFEPNLRVATAGGWALYIPTPPWIGGAAGCAGLLLLLIGLRNGSFILVRRRPLRSATAFGAALSLLIPSIAQAGGGGGLSDPPTYYWEISDPLGTGMVMMDSNGDRVRHQVFTPFGEVHAETGANFRTFYAGHRRDEDSGMFYMQARWYDPGAGRFLSIDPLIRSTATPQSANPYSYTENNPVNGTDPTGLLVSLSDGCEPPQCNSSGAQGKLPGGKLISTQATDQEVKSIGTSGGTIKAGGKLLAFSSVSENTVAEITGPTSSASGSQQPSEAGIQGFQSSEVTGSGIDVSIFTPGSVAPSAEDAANAAELIPLLMEIPALVQTTVEAAAAGPLSEAPNGAAGAAGKIGLMAANRLAIFRNTSAQNLLRERLSMPPINYDGVLRLGSYDPLRAPGEARDLSLLNTEIGVVRRRGGLDQ